MHKVFILKKVLKNYFFVIYLPCLKMWHKSFSAPLPCPVKMNSKPFFDNLKFLGASLPKNSSPCGGHVTEWGVNTTFERDCYLSDSPQAENPTDSMFQNLPKLLVLCRLNAVDLCVCWTESQGNAYYMYFHFSQL